MRPFYQISTFIYVIIIVSLIAVPIFLVNDQHIQTQQNAPKNELTQTDPDEAYLVGVVAAEMPAVFEIEALRAQAVAARSYAAYIKSHNNGIISASHKNAQEYRPIESHRDEWGSNYDTFKHKITDAVRSTARNVITFNGNIILAAYFSSSAGNTETAKDVWGESIPYLISVPSPWDRTVDHHANEYKTISLNELRKSLQLKKAIPVWSVYPSGITSGGNVKDITVGPLKIKATDFRRKLNLYSTAISIQYDSRSIKIHTRGNGHGVGMSQWGAQALALKGWKWQDIIHHYYTNVKIESVS